MRIDIMTLFPELIDTVLSSSIIGRARASEKILINIHNIRDYSEDKHRRVDDTPYGGGKGMLMAAPPIYNCYQHIITTNNEVNKKPYVIFTSPKGTTFNQELASNLSQNYDWIVILCGHYEGVDQRIIDEIVDEEISIGDYVLTGGEIPACIITDCISRLIPGVLSDAECYEVESFSNNLLEFPQYTRPPEFHGMKVPDVLLSGNHKNIDDWRNEESLRLTKEKRPDLLKK